MPRLTMAMTANPEPNAEAPCGQPGNPALYRLLTWLSPSFPIGAFSYSHGLETAVAGGAVHDRASLERWITMVVRHGGGRMDCDILCAAHRGARRLDGPPENRVRDRAALDAANRRGIAFRATAELALEAAQQGEAFLLTCRAAWPEPFVEAWASSRDPPEPPIGSTVGSGIAGGGAERSDAGEGPGYRTAPEGVCHSAVFGAVAGRAGIALPDALTGYLQSFAANLVSAGLRLGIIGQTDGQRILAALEPVVAAAAVAALTRDPADFGAATFAVDLASMMHETQYTRLFRS
jgi:urease accessory protein